MGHLAKLHLGLPKRSIKFRPVHTQGNGANELFCKKFLVQRESCLRQLLRVKRQVGIMKVK